jgi:hypothetical protein
MEKDGKISRTSTGVTRTRSEADLTTSESRRALQKEKEILQV